ncbi:MAG: DNA topoisomerase VI subunit B, partial [Thermoguttaceae bacterium]|nr:DNA topoisomerase VI subunit B [Thermoguttaceae bacterium]
ACAITQTIKSMNWRSYGLSQSRGALPSGPVSIMVHLASVWVPFTSESKEAIALYPEIQKELRLALQTVGRKLGMYLRRRMKVKQEADRRQQFLRYLGEIATATSAISGVNKDELHQKLIELAKSKTSMADVELDENGRPIEQPQQSPTEMDLGDNVLIVEQDAMQFIHRASNGTGQQKFDFDDSDEESESGDGADEQEGQDQQE